MNLFIEGLEKEADMVDIIDIFTCIRCFKGMFSPQIKEGAKSYQAPT